MNGISAKEHVEELCTRAKAASGELSVSSSDRRNSVLLTLSQYLHEADNAEALLSANALDIRCAEQNGVKKTMIDRLTLTPARIDAIASALVKLASLPDPLGKGDTFTRPNGLLIRRAAVPLGVVAIIFEARPNVTFDGAAICIKTGNTAILRGGKEAINTNIAAVALIKKALEANGLNGDCVGLVRDTSRESATALMEARGLVDVLIPRGGKGLIQSVCQNARVPVIETGAGNCHLYVEKTADINMAVNIAVNAKLQRPSVCNACESLVVDRCVADKFLPEFYAATRDKGLVFMCDEDSANILPEANIASDEDFYTEYNDYVVSVKLTDSTAEAVAWINEHSTHHSEAIITSDISASRYFTSHIDSAAVYVNASTRFTDGEEFGFGAEIGISTQKLHARGPMGPDQLTSVKYIVEGNGQVR